MPVLVTSNIKDDSIKNERASIGTPFSHYKSMGIFLDAQGQLTPKAVLRSSRHSNTSKILWMSSLPASTLFFSKINHFGDIKSHRFHGNL